jgi:hypothetical protein
MRTRLLIVLLGLAILAGCTSTSEGTPRPTTTSDASQSTPLSGSESPDDNDLPFAGAPAVNDPLDTQQFQQNPCQVLTEAQTQELVVVAGEPHDAPLGNACEWKSPDDRLAAVDVEFLNEDPRGLSALYDANEKGGYVYFDELEPIEGYPAVARDGVDDRPMGKCTVVVGTSNKEAFAVILRLSHANVGKKDPCDTAAMIAGMALRTMKAGS